MNPSITLQSESRFFRPVQWLQGEFPTDKAEEKAGTSRQTVKGFYSSLATTPAAMTYGRTWSGELTFRDHDGTASMERRGKLITARRTGGGGEHSRGIFKCQEGRSDGNRVNEREEPKKPHHSRRKVTRSRSSLSRTSSSEARDV